MIALDSFCPLWPTILNQFLNHAHCAQPTTLGSFPTYTSGEVLMLEPGGFATKPISRKAESAVKKPVFINENVTSGKTLARSSFVFEIFCAHRGFKRERLKGL